MRIGCIFFCKQKTAYEMRISVWSSDVCSSDLCGRSGLKLPALSLGLWHNFGGDTPHRTKQALCRKAFDLGITHFDLANNYGPPPGSAEEIGRASCRERVCQYVSISVVAVSLKKK